MSDNAAEPIAVMVLAPHPDDAELACAGTVLKLVKQGTRVAVADMSRGERASGGSAAEREAECAKATAELGIAARVNLGLPDAALRDDDRALHAVVGVIRRWRPRLLLAPFDRDLHPDHAATGAVAARAFFHSGLRNFQPELGPPHRPRLLLRYPLHDDAAVTLCVDTSDFATRKLAIVRCYRSQIPSGDRSHLASLDVAERAVARDAYWGMRVGCRAAEPFAVERPALLSDLALLLGHP